MMRLRFIGIFLGNFVDALISAICWCGVWFGIFMLSTIVVEELDGNAAQIEMTALSLTAAVFAGHATKLISYAIGSDTEFRGAIGPRRSNDTETTQPFRFWASFAFLAAAGYFLIQNIGAAIIPEIVLHKKFTIYSAQFWQVIGLMFAAQLVFSWPAAVRAQLAGAS